MFSAVSNKKSEKTFHCRKEFYHHQTTENENKNEVFNFYCPQKYKMP